jgi:hypothetical protein
MRVIRNRGRSPLSTSTLSTNTTTTRKSRSPTPSGRTTTKIQTTKSGPIMDNRYKDVNKAIPSFDTSTYRPSDTTTYSTKTSPDRFTTASSFDTDRYRPSTDYGVSSTSKYSTPDSNGTPKYRSSPDPLSYSTTTPKTDSYTPKSYDTEPTYSPNTHSNTKFR